MFVTVNVTLPAFTSVGFGVIENSLSVTPRALPMAPLFCTFASRSLTSLACE